MKFRDSINKSKVLLDRNDKIFFLVLSFVTFIGLLLEIFGIAIIIPIISTSVSSDSLVNFTEIIDITYISAYLGFSNEITFLLTSLLIVFLIKMIFFIILYYYQKTFVSKIINKISNKLFYKYSNQEINYYSQKNRSLIIQNLQNETYYLFLFFESLTLLISESFLIIFLLFFVLFIDSESLFFLVIYFGISTIVYTLFTRKKSVLWGNMRLKMDQFISKTIIETFGSIKEIIVNNSQSYFNSNYYKLNNKKYKYFAYRLTLDQIPKIYYEFITVLFIIFYTYYLNVQDISNTEIITRLGILIAVAYKIIPALAKVSASYQTIKNTSSSLRIIYDEIINLKVTENKRKLITSFKESIILKNIEYSYPKTNFSVFKKINLEIQKNQIIGIIGKSGNGKTTLIDILSGLIKDFKGEVIIDNSNFDTNTSIWKPNVSYVSQNTFIYEDTLKKNITISKPNSKLNQKLLEKAIKMSQLTDWVNSLENDENTILSQDGMNISGGQKQRIGIARAIYNDSNLLIFDEPTSSLDALTEKEIIQTIEGLKREKTIIIVSHNKKSLRICDKIIEIK